MATKNYYSIDSDDKFFCKCDIPNPADATEFLDSATAKTITANGNATQLPIKFNKSAGFFNGTTDYVDISNSTDFAFGTGAFTIEGFFNTGIAATAQTILDTRTATANTTGLLVNIINSTGNKLCVTTATTARITGTTTLAKNTWYHFMVVGNGGANGARTIILYLDGVQEGSTYTNDYNFTDQTLRIGAIKAAAGTYMNGWMKELRISNVARTVAVPTAQYKSDANTVLLMHFDTPATSPLGPAIAFDGTGDYLSVADSADWDVSTGEFTAEGFFQWNATSGMRMFCFGAGNSGGSSGKGIYLEQNSGLLRASINTNQKVTATFAPVVGVWYHIALVRTGTDLYIFVNGVNSGSGTSSDDITGSTEGVLLGTGTAMNEYFNGNIREFRFSNVARYPSSFTPSKTGFTVDANTKLYIKGNEDNGVTTFVDSSTSPKTVTTNGDTKIKYTEDYRSCIFKDETGKFPYPQGSAKVDFFAIGDGVGYFDGTGDYLSCDSSDDWKFGTDDYTYEIYFRYVGTLGDYQLIDCSVYVGGGWGVRLHGATSFSVNTGGSSQNDWDTVTVPTMVANTWYHAAISRSGTTIKAFLNGTEYRSWSDSYDYKPTRALEIGDWFYTYNSSHNSYFNGLLDNIRISKGVARYTTTFNPPEFRTFIPRAILI